MDEYKLTSVSLTIWLFMAFTVLDIFQENAVHPHQEFTLFSFGFVIFFCAFSGILFYCYKNKI